MKPIFKTTKISAFWFSLEFFLNIICFTFDSETLATFFPGVMKFTIILTVMIWF